MNHTHTLFGTRPTALVRATETRALPVASAQPWVSCLLGAATHNLSPSGLSDLSLSLCPSALGVCRWFGVCPSDLSPAEAQRVPNILYKTAASPMYLVPYCPSISGTRGAPSTGSLSRSTGLNRTEDRPGTEVALPRRRREAGAKQRFESFTGKAQRQTELHVVEEEELLRRNPRRASRRVPWASVERFSRSHCHHQNHKDDHPGPSPRTRHSRPSSIYPCSRL